jgi:hypothetical protein
VQRVKVFQRAAGLKKKAGLKVTAKRVPPFIFYLVFGFGRLS